MTSTVYAAVLIAALAHAMWNGLMKHKVEPLLAVTLLAIGCGIVATPFALAVGFPAAATWPYLAITLVVHFAYYVALAIAYRHGDLGQIYPIARGTAPLLTALGALLMFGERMSATGIAGIIALASGVLLLSLRGNRVGAAFNIRAIGFALMTAVTICAYTLLDAGGTRAGPTPWPYIFWLPALTGVMMIAFAIYRWSWPDLRTALRANPRIVWGGGILSTGSYAIALWAMTIAPVGLVAALRETSVLFAAAIGVVMLGEPILPNRIVAGLLVAAGVICIRLA